MDKISDNFKPIRKMGNLEIYFLNNQNRRLVTYCLKLKSKINLNDNQDLVLKAIKEWKKLHPFLRCKVTSILNEQRNNKEHYFCYQDDDSNKNIKFISLEDKESVKLIVEKEPHLEIDINNELMWRILICIVNDDIEKGQYLIFTIHHSIMDGRCSYYILLQLLDIIESIYLGKFKPIEGEPMILESIEELFFKNMNTLISSLLCQSIHLLMYLQD